MEFPFDALQAGLFAHLNTHVTVPVYDLPADQPLPYVSFGPASEDPGDDLDGPVFQVTQQIDVWSKVSRKECNTILNAVASRLWQDGDFVPFEVEGYQVIDVQRGQSRIDVPDTGLIQGTIQVQVLLQEE